MNKKPPYPEHLARGYPPGVTPDRRRIKSCSRLDAWYRNKIGEVITVHYFATFGVRDTEGRNISYYDLSRPIKKLLTDSERKQFIKEELDRVKEAKNHMNKWDDIPVNMQLSSLCRILNIKEGDAALKFCTGLLIGSDDENAQILFDVRNHEYV